MYGIATLHKYGEQDASTDVEGADIAIKLMSSLPDNKYGYATALMNGAGYVLSSPDPLTDEQIYKICEWFFKQEEQEFLHDIPQLGNIGNLLSDEHIEIALGGES